MTGFLYSKSDNYFQKASSCAKFQLKKSKQNKYGKKIKPCTPIGQVLNTDWAEIVKDVTV